MGHRHSRHRAPSGTGSFTRAQAASSEQPSKSETPIITPPKYPFRCERRENIPDALVEGPFEDFEIATDVYATAYLVARNASPEMYSFSPFKNPQVRIVWAYLLFIITSQLFVILAITVWFPPSVNSTAIFVDCANVTSFEELHKRGYLLGAHSIDDCREAAGGEASFKADLYGEAREFYKIERGTPFYNAVLTQGTLAIYVLRLICCAWVFSQVYFGGFNDVTALFEYHDFSRWFIPLKGYTVQNSWALCFPLIQFSVMLVVTVVSFVMICSMNEAFDIVLNSLAFTFIAEVGSYFNAPLAKKLGATEIAMKEKKSYTINYLYPDYRLDNAINPDGSYTDDGWYILEEEMKSGLLSDYRVRHNPKLYAHSSESIMKALEWILILTPALSVLVGAMRAHLLNGILSSRGPEL